MEAYEGSKRTFEINKQKLRITIKPGSYDGLQLKIKGKGQAGINGTSKGDLFIILRVENDPRFTRSADNPAYEANSDLYTAVLGGKIEVPTLSKPLIMNIPEGVESRKTLRLKGKGMPKYGRKNQFGDLFVKIKIDLPKNLTKEEKTLFEKLRKLREKETVNV
jgi:curved DNA-binding protein